MDFKKITLEAKSDIWRYTLPSNVRNCDFTFANLCSWWFLYRTEYALVDDFLVLRFYLDEKPVYMIPVGRGELSSVIQKIQEDAFRHGDEFCMAGVSAEMKETLEDVLPGRFRFEENRNYADYIYLREELALLKGKKFQAKRNHVNHFRKEYPHYEYRNLTPELVPECLQLEEKWCKANGCYGQMALWSERCSMLYALTHCEELGILGGVLFVDGQIVAFTYGAPINSDTWDVCAEKANTDIEGSYAMINYEYVNHLPQNYVYVNREEDLGLEGLRKAKLSYQPHYLLDKYIATWI